MFSVNIFKTRPRYAAKRKGVLLTCGFSKHCFKLFEVCQSVFLFLIFETIQLHTNNPVNKFESSQTFVRTASAYTYMLERGIPRIF